jgi:cobalt/nickel transport system permease protein
VTRTDILDRTVAELGEYAQAFLRAERLATRDGFLQTVTPAVKLVGLGVLIVVTVSLDRPGKLAAMLGLAVLLAGLSRISIRRVAVRAAAPAGFSFTIVAPQLLLVPGPPVLSPLPVSPAAVAVVGTFVLRVTAAVSLLSLLLLTTRFAAVVAGLRRLRVPDIAVTLLAITHRYLLVFFDELTRTVLARKSRTLPEADWSLRQSYRDTGSLLGTFLLRTIERGERVQRAARARGGTRMRPYRRHASLGRADLVFGVLVAVVSGVMLV